MITSATFEPLGGSVAAGFGGGGFGGGDRFGGGGLRRGGFGGGDRFGGGGFGRGDSIRRRAAIRGVSAAAASAASAASLISAPAIGAYDDHRLQNSGNDEERKQAMRGILHQVSAAVCGSYPRRVRRARDRSPER